MAAHDRAHPRVRTTLGQQSKGQASERDLGELSTRLCEAGGLQGWTLAAASVPLAPCTVAWALGTDTGWTVCPPGPLHRGLGSGDGHWLDRLPFWPPAPWPGLWGQTLASTRYRDTQPGGLRLAETLHNVTQSITGWHQGSTCVSVCLGGSVAWVCR